VAEATLVEPKSSTPAPTAARPRSSVGGNVLLALVSLVVFLALAELSARLLYWVRWGRHLYPVQTNAYVFPLGWSLAPGVYRGQTIDSLGFRRRTEVALRPAAGTTRIFLVGGSTAFGTNGLYPQVKAAPIHEEETIDHHLEDLLNHAYPDRHFEVVNAGVPEYRLFQEFSLFREKLLNLQPSMVIFLDGHNDISFLTGAASGPSRAAPYWSNRNFERGQRVLNSEGLLSPIYFLDIWLGRTSYAYHMLSTLLQGTVNQLGTAGSSAGESAWGAKPFVPGDDSSAVAHYQKEINHAVDLLPLYVNQVRDLRAIADSRAIPILYVLQPELLVEPDGELTNHEKATQTIAFDQHRDLGTLEWRVLTRAIADSLRFVATPRFSFLDATHLAQRDSADLYTDYCHLTSLGNRRLAELLLPQVSQLLGAAAHSPRS
jgi:hypothetical protein